MKYKFKIRKTSCPSDQYRDGHHSTEPLLANHVEKMDQVLCPLKQRFHNTFRCFNNEVEW